MGKGDAWGTGWMAVALLLAAVVIVLVCMHPGLNLNWAALGAIGSAIAAIAVVGIAWRGWAERRGERRKLDCLRKDGILTDSELQHVETGDPVNEDDELIRHKEVEFYAASVNAWLSYGQELSKQILTFSSAGLALLMAILTHNKFAVHAEIKWIVYLCIGSFIVSIFLVLAEFKRNRKYIESMLSGHGHKDRDWVLRLVGFFSVAAFFLGLLALAAYVVININ